MMLSYHARKSYRNAGRLEVLPQGFRQVSHVGIIDHTVSKDPFLDLLESKLRLTEGFQPRCTHFLGHGNKIY